MKCERLKECCDAHLRDDSPFTCDYSSKCIAFNDNRPEITCIEKKKAYSLQNTCRSRAVLYHMDGGVISDLTLKKCDYLISIAKTRGIIAILVELKGTDIWHAIEQINATLDAYKDFFVNCKCVYGRIVPAQGPKIMADPKVMRLIKRLNKLNGNLKIYSKRMSEKDVDL